jgi:hypothetical protein
MKKFLCVILALILLAGVSCTERTAESGPILKITYTLTDYDASGKIVKTVTRPSRSYVQAMAYLLSIQFSQTTETVTDQSNTGRSIATGSGQFNVGGAAGSTSYGILAGTGTNAVAITDYKIQTLIGNGTSSGQMTYGAVTFGAVSVAGSSASFTVVRALTNNSGASITVNELALYCANGTYYFCLIHDNVSGGQAVGNGHVLAVTYTITITV